MSERAGTLHRMRYRAVFQGALCLGAVLAVVGGATLASLHFIDPDIRFLPRLEAGYRHLVFGFVFLTIFAVAAAALEALGRKTAPPETAPTRSEPVPEARAVESRLSALYHEMKTYVDLEMWELALEKAGEITKNHPGTREAEIVSKSLNELRWKAEPKYVTRTTPISTDQEKQLREKGLAQMYQHVRTYMDLEMWELARQKAIAILKGFPESPEAAELTKIYETIDRKARETSPEQAPRAGA